MSTGDASEAERQAALQSNEAFYRAFAGGDYVAMDSLWARAEGVLCVHPGAPPVHGRDAVMESWREILTQPPPIEFEDPQIEIVRGVAFVTCIESFGGRRLAATNVFVWESGRWRLTHHQASPIAPPAPIATRGTDTVH